MTHDPATPRRVAPDVAALYQTHSAHVRGRGPDLATDADRRPLPFRTYPGAPRIALPGRDLDGLDASIGALLGRRQSRRRFSLARPLPAATLGRLLYASFGVLGVRAGEDGRMMHARPTPSAGALYPLELYVALQRVDGIPDGLYHYDPVAHALEWRATGAPHERLATMTIEQHMLVDAHVVVLITAVFARTMWKYQQRGYRYVWLDAGHVGQNCYLVADALGLGAVAIGGFYDAELAALLDLSRGEEEVVYLVCAGTPADDG